MYHYLKWAALSLFFRRNVRYLLLILISLIGIYGVDAVYRDLVDYFVATGRGETLLILLILKWAVVLALVVLLLFSIMRLGFGRELKGTSPRKKTKSRKISKDISPADDRVMQRLEKFRDKKRLKRKSELLMERLEREKRS
jgi:hypothetical protein